jgi:hypothetical protein
VPDGGKQSEQNRGGERTPKAVAVKAVKNCGFHVPPDSVSAKWQNTLSAKSSRIELCDAKL